MEKSTKKPNFFQKWWRQRIWDKLDKKNLYLYKFPIIEKPGAKLVCEETFNIRCVHTHEGWPPSVVNFTTQEIIFRGLWKERNNIGIFVKTKKTIPKAIKSGVKVGGAFYLFQNKVLPFLKKLSDEETVVKRGESSGVDEMMDNLQKNNKNYFPKKIDNIVFITNPDDTLNRMTINNEDYKTKTTKKTNIESKIKRLT
jgi:hypothetical protein